MDDCCEVCGVQFLDGECGCLPHPIEHAPMPRNPLQGLDDALDEIESWEEDPS